MAQEGDAVYYPQEMLDLNWNTTSKEKIQEVYKVWAGHYDRVCFELPKCFGRKQPKFREATSSFPAKWPRRNDCRNAVLMTSHYPADLSSASDWLKQISLPARLIRSSTLALTTSPVSVKFLRLCHRRHFVGKPVVGSRTRGGGVREMVAVSLGYVLVRLTLVTCGRCGLLLWKLHLSRAVIEMETF